jgi:hypothetical protein
VPMIDNRHLPHNRQHSFSRSVRVIRNTRAQLLCTVRTSFGKNVFSNACNSSSLEKPCSDVSATKMQRRSI